MLNTGMTQKDISDLKQDQVDWEKGTIRRKRSKTKHQDGVPEVEYALWPETFELLKEHRSSDASRVLLNKQGGSLFEQSIKANGKLKKTDNIKSAFSRVARKLNITTVTLKQFRATSATILNKHGDYHRLTQHFLGQSPRTIADRHYVVQSQELFDKAVKWLRKQYGIS
jgi:integrase